MSAFVERIDICLKVANIKRVALCDALKISHTSITDWNRRNTIPAADITFYIADYLHVSPRWLVFGTGAREDGGGEAQGGAGLSAEEKQLLDDMRLLTPEEKNGVKALINGYKLAHDAEAEKKVGLGSA